MKKIEWTSQLEKCLRDQVITADQPGPVLKDFGLILDYVGTKGVKSAGKYHLLPISCIPELDPHLSRPLALDLKRPQLRSHPYLQGLNLLLRASGLGRVEGTGAKSRLILDPVMLEQWNRLNPTEQYFNLLESWLRYGRAIMVGDTDRQLGTTLSACLQAWSFLPENARELERGSESIYLVGIDRALYQLALLDLFGLVDVVQSPPGGERWIPETLRPTPFGDAVLTLLDINVHRYTGELLSEEDESEDEAEDEIEGEDEREDEGEYEEYKEDEGEDEGEYEEDEAGLYEPVLGIWQPLFQPYFPEWRENLVFPRWEPREGTFFFHVSLTPTIWRRIAMPADASLDKLVGWILRSMKFDSDHLYMFTYTDSMGAKVRVSCPEAQEGPWADEISIGNLPLEPGQSMELRYDFGDNWRFTIKLEKVEPPDAKVKAPHIVEQHGKAPKQYPDWDE